MKSVSLCVLLLGLSQVGLARAEQAGTRFEFAEIHMGTRFELIFYAKDEEQAREAAKAAFARIAYLDATMSDYRPTSELMKLVGKAGGPPVRVSAELFFVLSKAEEVSKLSGGAFDITIRPVVGLWRLSRRTQKLPKPDKLKSALELVDYRNVVLDPKKRTVELKKAGMQLDLGGIAKGYAADEAHKVLQKRGISRALVAAGGDITVTDPPPGKKGWDIAIAAVDPERGEKLHRFPLSNGSVSTSGDINQFVQIDGKRYSHIADPRTGLGLPGRMSVTVIADNGITADSLATTVSILGEVKGSALAKKVGAKMRFVRLVNGKKRSVYEGAFPKSMGK